MQKEGAQLGALVLHFFQGALELLGHVIEGAGEHADLVSGGHLDFVGKVAVRHPFSALGQPLNGVISVLDSRKERSTEMIRPKINASTISVISSLLRADTLAVVLHIDDVAALAPLYCHGYVHIGGGGELSSLASSPASTRIRLRESLGIACPDSLSSEPASQWPSVPSST